MTNNRQFRPPAPRAPDPFDGILLVDKPAGPTSHDIVDSIRRKFGFNKVGHGGTLDPQATGLLVILLGKGTKLSDRFMGADKVYEGTMRLGIETDTQDAQGKTTREADATAVTAEQLQAAMGKFTGDIMQTPPMVSAAKVGGVPLYKLARKGKTVPREPKLIHVYEFKLLDFKPPDASFIIRCTKGTYVRTLCSDVGAALGCGAHLAQLRRLQSGDFKIEECSTLDSLLAMSLEQLVDKVILLTKLMARTGTAL
ncbi:MAG: tRNA pseudouridine(55) synthase TruB [Verrucomicrobia bacterium]|nr:tRNA pseudouridine(55) synthase TruB [Verrucomicrobiota bacterium]